MAPKPIPPEKRFWRHVQKTDWCWIWMGSKSRGYGRFRHTTRSFHSETSAHRFAYEMLVGPIPKGKQIDHLCRNPSCVNPDHMEPVTSRTNTLRSNAASAINAKKTHCPKGHALSGDNLRRTQGRRHCKTCQRDWMRRKREGLPRVPDEQKRENRRRGSLLRWSRADRSKCRNGHAMTDENTRITSAGVRQCVACARERGLRWWRKQNADRPRATPEQRSQAGRVAAAARWGSR